MKVLTEGHYYELAHFEKDESGSSESIQFIEKVAKGEGQVQELVTINNGTTNEEVLTMLIDRMYYLQNKFPCRENAIVITKLEESLMWLEQRTKKRIKQNVEGKNLNHK